MTYLCITPSFSSILQSVLLVTCAMTWLGAAACTSGVPSVLMSSAVGVVAPSRMERYTPFLIMGVAKNL